MRTLNGVKLTEKEFRHVKARYLKFALEENQCSNRCPMGWEGTGGNIKIELGVKIYIKTRRGRSVFCCCQLFKEFDKNACPCKFYETADAFRRLDKVAKRLKRMK